ncbi:MAG TPA: hypothetical protein VF881_17860 [Polyangiaceae bacterium]
MNTFTIPGVAPDPNARGHRPPLGWVTKPIFSRPKRRPVVDAEPSVVAPVSSSFRPFETHELQFLQGIPDDDVVITPAFHETPIPYVVPVSNFRRGAVRFFGTLLIGGAFYICFGILRQSQVHDAVLSWASMGHEAELKSAANHVGAGVDWGRHKYGELVSGPSRQ